MPAKAAPDHSVAPPTVPNNFAEMLREADEVLALLESESLDIVAELANSLSVSARGTGAGQIAEAADVVHRIASGHHMVTLTGAIRDLSTAIARTRCEYHLE